MKDFKIKLIVSLGIVIGCTASLFAQDTNCFLEDFEPKEATITVSAVANKTMNARTATVTLSADTLSKISKYVFGNSIAVWMGHNTGESKFVENTTLLSPSLIRFPGGSWSNVYFWDELPNDIPDNVFDSSGNPTEFFPIPGKDFWTLSTEEYYILREQTGSQGLITVNYGYARYGLSDDPVAQAARLAADWVRHDNGRTKFWEIGNENAGPWEKGWKIDTSTNKDGQPEIITGQLYGQHFNVFADSMRAAAAEVGATIYIGAQVLHYDGTTSWNSVDRTWNEGVFSEIGDAADFYVMHNYFGEDSNAGNMLSDAVTEPKKNIDFIRQDIIDKNGFPKPVAITEYNMDGRATNTGGDPEPQNSNINGLQATILFNELIKNDYGMSARWLLATGDDGMFYQGNNASLRWQPRPDFYYAYYTQKFTGDHAIPATSNNENILAYASRFAAGETGVMIVNKGSTAQVVQIDPNTIGVGDQYYAYLLSGGADNGDFSSIVSVNGVGPTGTQWGPRETLEAIPANAYSIDEAIKLDVPAWSVQFVMIETGDNHLLPTAVASELKNEPGLMNYPNPFSGSTTIQFQTSTKALVVLDVFNQTGTKISTLVNKELPSGTHQIDFNGSLLPSGLYFYQLRVGNYSTTRKMILKK
ncbi:T9SS type A sorting domain-containing protein [Gaoshiqia sp. Z1-71]|uniref:T9SS type A sorting domain-containing protein n=1 Tax=Gaoshiqia hydrogeniformans TaxID=3290090 RepID=UPI003BF7A7F4